MDCKNCLGAQTCHVCGGRGRSDASGIRTTCPMCDGTGRCQTCRPMVASAARHQSRTGPLTSAEAGVVSGSATLHAVRKTLSGAKALCGAGAVTITAARFDPTAVSACSECTASRLLAAG